CKDGFKYPEDCTDLSKLGHMESGVYVVKPLLSNQSIVVFCDLEGGEGGWTVIFRKMDLSVPKKYLYKNSPSATSEYVNGTGQITEEFWMGLRPLYRLMKGEPHIMQVELENLAEETRWALYMDFRLTPIENNSRMFLGDYYGTAGNGTRDAIGIELLTSEWIQPNVTKNATNVNSAKQ
ncbi:hypothetical protein SK128_015343, partial [Halocaridina rubra]